MPVLVLGADGFIGRNICEELQRANINIISVTRKDKDFDFSKPINIDAITAQLKKVDAVINAVGTTHARSQQEMYNIHYNTPKTIYEIASKIGTPKIIHISDFGAIKDSSTTYATSKTACEEFIKTLHTSWVILRPSTVYDAKFNGGLKIFKYLSMLPYVAPIIGNGKQKAVPIYIKDLTKAIMMCLSYSNISQVTIDMLGPEVLTIEEIMSKIRFAYKHKQTRFLHMPSVVIQMLAKIGDLLPFSLLNTASFTVLQNSAVGSAQQFETIFGFKPQAMIEVIKAEYPEPPPPPVPAPTPPADSNTTGNNY